jgi:hypothetical protein
VVTCPPPKTGPVKMRVLLSIKPERRTEHEAEPFYRGTDHGGVEGRGRGSTGARDQPEARDL